MVNTCINDTSSPMSLDYEVQSNVSRLRLDSTSSCSSIPLSPSSFSSSSFFTSSSASLCINYSQDTQPESPIRKTAIPSDSPLLTKPPVDSRQRRFRSFNKDLRRARSFRASRERPSDTVTSYPSVLHNISIPTPGSLRSLPLPIWPKCLSQHQGISAWQGRVEDYA
jgi:hypothetical protein